MTQTVHELVDIGVNLVHKRFAKDREQVLQHAREAGVTQMIVTGTDTASSEAAAELCEAHPGTLFSTAGVHPHNADAWNSDMRRHIAGLGGTAAVVAIGEAGLDFNRNFSTPANQEKAFAAQLEIAAELSLPVFLHQRDAHERFMAIIREYRDHLVGGVAHCFTGGRDELWPYLDAGLHIGVTGWICDERRGGPLRDCVGDIPADRLMIETDAPFLTPRDLSPKPRGGRNEPAFLPHVLEAVARHAGRPLDQVARESTDVARRFFRLPAPA
ncbi:TatD family hydrolase [Ectothiorhodospiraceae bacterium WFHF3C12]|nr:TatD family hydrolase [Ectothiorhodospiraceae bacterium WFHF3C12]